MIKNTIKCKKDRAEYCPGLSVYSTIKQYVQCDKAILLKTTEVL